MKKYILVFSVLAFVFSFFINVNSVSATGPYNESGYMSGCQSGDKFSRTTGQSCGENAVRSDGCLLGHLFSPTTGRSCGTTQPFIFTQTLRYGMTNNAEVSELQKFLIAKGYLQGTPNGMIYQTTQDAIKRFQVVNGLIADGIVGVRTRMLLNYMQGDLSGNTTALPVLTQAQAQTLVLQTWGGCTPDTCGSANVTVQNNNGQYIVTAIYEGLRDDSSSAQKKVALAYYINGSWTLGTATITQRCWFGRGHQDFSAALCI